jgi:hypothetical protein
MKINAKQTTIRTLIALKQDIYARAQKRAQDLQKAGGDLKSVGLKLQAIHKRADQDAAKIVYAINMIKVRA